MTIISLGMQFGLQHIRKMSIGEAIALRANEGDERCIAACEEHPELFSKADTDSEILEIAIKLQEGQGDV